MWGDQSNDSDMTQGSMTQGMGQTWKTSVCSHGLEYQPMVYNQEEGHSGGGLLDLLDDETIKYLVTGAIGLLIFYLLYVST